MRFEYPCPSTFCLAYSATSRLSKLTNAYPFLTPVSLSLPTYTLATRLFRRCPTAFSNSSRRSSSSTSSATFVTRRVGSSSRAPPAEGPPGYRDPSEGPRVDAPGPPRIELGRGGFEKCQRKRDQRLQLSRKRRAKGQEGNDVRRDVFARTSQPASRSRRTAANGGLLAKVGRGRAVVTQSGEGLLVRALGGELFGNRHAE